MSESLVEKPERAGVDTLLGDLADNMRVYDGLVTERLLARERVQQTAEVVEGLDLEIPVRNHPSEVAYNSLALLIAERKLAKLEAGFIAADTTDFEAYIILNTERLLGQKVRVESLDTENHKLSTLRKNQYGNLDGLSRWHHTKQGKILDIGLSSETGGFIQIKGAFGLIYQAAPLIDRENDYSAAFSFQPLN